jgi:hypothetical protein
MQIFLYTLTEGPRRVLRHWRVLVPLYLVGLLFGLVQTWPLLFGGALYNPFLADLATGGLDVLANLFIGSQSSAAGAGVWALVTLLLLLLFGLAYNFFAGGVLGVYTGRGDFWAGCWRTIWSFIALGLLLLILLVAVLIGSFLLGGALGLRGGLIAALVLIQLINLVGEYARAVAVVRDRRNPFALLGLAISFCVRHLGGVLLLALIGVALHVAAVALYGLVASAVSGSPIAILWQQAIVLAWLLIKLLRLAWAASYIQAASAVDGAAPSRDAALTVA